MKSPDETASKSPAGQGRSLTAHQLWYGRDEPPPPVTNLQAGSVSARLMQGDLRYVRLGETELVRRLYFALRDENWGTIPGELTNHDVQIHKESWAVSLDAHHRSRDIDFLWHAAIEGNPDSSITYIMRGTVQSAFRYCRIGLCVLHSPDEYAGMAYRATTPGGLVSGQLPHAIGVQRYEGGLYYPMFPSFSNLTVSLKSGVEVQYDFEGDLFEMEDQRNWTDASFKTYGTPLALGYPHMAHPGQTFTQRIKITPAGIAGQPRTPSKTVRLSLGAPLNKTLPSLGLGVAHDRGLSPTDEKLLRPLKLDHLRVDLHLRDQTFASRLRQAETECAALGCHLELALFFTGEAAQELGRLLEHLPLRAPVSRVLVFHENTEETTSQQLVQLVRGSLAPHLPGVPMGGGTSLDFAELNRFRPVVDGFDIVTYSINPQVHAADELSLVENIEAQKETVENARLFCGDVPVTISPVTLKPRPNPAVAPSLTSQEALPDFVDPRQMSLFAAVWTLGSIKQLAEAGVASVTYYETTGWLGVKETEQGSLNPRLFLSSPDLTFPVYQVFADLADLKKGQLLRCESTDPLRIQGLALVVDGATYLLVANLTSETQACVIEPLRAGAVRVRTLDDSSAPLAMRDPSQFRSAAKKEVKSSGDSKITLTLAPYCFARIDASKAGAGDGKRS